MKITRRSLLKQSGSVALSVAGASAGFKLWGTASAAQAAESSTGQAPKPNILWITAEDFGPAMGCYGDPDADTPTLDSFAAKAVRFTQVHSVHPCCSPSRACLVTGMYPTTLGTLQHRGNAVVSDKLVRCFPALLREAGYYTFNGSGGSGSVLGTTKTDYNFTPAEKVWDKLAAKDAQDPEWRNRAAGQPFFGQINLSRTHQGQYGLRKVGEKDEKPSPVVHEPARVHLPAYLPDTPAVREIWAEYHDRGSEMDAQFGALLGKLQEDGLLDETIIFFFGDNGHGVPGGKAWLWEQGVHVPLLVRWPAKWQHLAPAAPGSVSDQLISFLDFAPTVLSLAGATIPQQMRGSVFAGSATTGSRQYVFAARDFHTRADFDASRMVRDDRYHYIRNFMPHIGWDAGQYTWAQAPYMLEEWRQQAQEGKLRADTRQACFYRRSKPVEELYDIRNDPDQMNNLAGDKQYQEVLERMRAECQKWMIENHDLGLLSQYEFYARLRGDSHLEMGADPQRNPIQRLLEAANIANTGDPANLGRLKELLRDPDPAMRRWGAIGMLTLRQQAAPARDALTAASDDASPDVRMTAAEASLAIRPDDAAVSTLIKLLSDESPIVRSETLLTFSRVGDAAAAALPHLDDALRPANSTRFVPDLVSLAKACLGDPAGAALKLTRQRHLP